MKSRNVQIIFFLILIILMTGCSNTTKSETTTESKAASLKVESEAVVSNISELAKDLEEAEQLPEGNIVGCGEAFIQDEMKYSVIGVRNDEVDGTNYLVLKMEAYNDSSENYNFSSLMNINIINDSGKEGDLDIMYPHFEMDLLDGNILSGNKIVGEVAFDITEIQSDEYIVQIGKMMEYRDAIRIKSEDIGKRYDAVFVNSGVKSDFTIGDTMDFDGVLITFDGVRIEPVNTYDPKYNKEGMGLMILDMTMVNHSDKDVEFTSVGMFSTLRSVCATDGTELEYESYSYENNFPVVPEETRSETFGLYYKLSDTDFYLTLNPNINERENVTIVTFNIN